MSRDFLQTILLLLGGAVVLYLVITALVFMGSSRTNKRYRPGRPFVFVPVWFLSAPQHQARAGLPGRELTPGPTTVRRPLETGGASDTW